MSDKIAFSIDDISKAIAPYQNEIVGGLAGATVGGLGTAAMVPGQRPNETHDEYVSRRNRAALIGALGAGAAGVGVGHFLKEDPVAVARQQADEKAKAEQAAKDKTLGGIAWNAGKTLVSDPKVQMGVGGAGGFAAAQLADRLNPNSVNSPAGWLHRATGVEKNLSGTSEGEKLIRLKSLFTRMNSGAPSSEAAAKAFEAEFKNFSKVVPRRVIPIKSSLIATALGMAVPSAISKGYEYFGSGGSK